MPDPRLLPVANSAAFLPEAGSLRRFPRHPGRPRPKEFFDRFEFFALVYDAFWHHDGTRVLLVGPHPRNLLLFWHGASLVAQPSGKRLKPRFYVTVSVMVTELPDVPADTRAITLDFAGNSFSLPVQPSSVPSLAGARVLFSMNKDNDLAWIAEWARFHVDLHGTDAVILFDNASTRYGVAEVERTLLAVPGLRHVAVPAWPYRFGPIDPAVQVNPYWSRFLQTASMSVVLRRYAARAYGLLNADIDELTLSLDGASAYDKARASRAGLLSYRGRWIEAVSGGTAGDHRDYGQSIADPAKSLSRQKKWVLDPTRPWLSRLSVHPYWHWIEGRPVFAKQTPKDLTYRHFRGINTGWKDNRNASLAADADLVVDEALRAAWERRRTGPSLL